jgi:hypothetical protein
VRGDPVVRVHPDSAGDLEDGAAVEVRSGDAVVAATVRLDADALPGVAAVAARDAGMNRLAPWVQLARAPRPAPAGVSAG